MFRVEETERMQVEEACRSARFLTEAIAFFEKSRADPELGTAEFQVYLDRSGGFFLDVADEAASSAFGLLQTAGKVESRF